MTDKPIKQILARPEKLGRIAKWGIELEERDIEFKGRNNVKGQILADFLAGTPSAESNEKEAKETTDEEKEPENMWKLYTDRASSSDSSGAGLMLVVPERKEYTYALRFKFNTTNNEAPSWWLTVGIKSLLNAVSITATLIDVNAAQSKKLLLLEEVTTARGSYYYYWKLRLLRDLEEKLLRVNVASEEVSTAELVSTAYVIYMDQDSAHMVAASKVPMLKPGEFELWRMRIEQYIQMIDYALWEVIENYATLPKTQVVEGVTIVMPITSAEDKAQRILEEKYFNNGHFQ
ncbi:hypothetical protein Tco_1021977 [Tanacetum coccineum]